MAKFDTIKAEEIKYGNNTFLEIALKKVQGEDGVESKVISLSKGWYPQNAEEIDKEYGNERGRGRLKQMLGSRKAVDRLVEMATAEV